MEQREKLIDIIAGSPVTSIVSYESTRELAAHLLANGVLVSPCRCGDTLYDIYEAFYNGEGDARALKVTDIHIHLDKRNKAWIIIGGYYFALDDFGKTVFLTREEAEEALEKRKGGE